MLPFPNNPPLENIQPHPRTCYKIGTNRTITEETAFNVLFIDNTRPPGIILETIKFDSEKLDLNKNYSTESRTFATIEVFSDGYYLGNGWMTKERQIVTHKGMTANYTYDEYYDFSTIILAKTLAAGYVPSPYLIAQQPDPNEENPFINKLRMRWYSYLIKPMPTVELYVIFP